MDTLKQYGLTTSIKGIPRAIKSKSLPMRILWSAAVISFLALGSFHSYYLTRSYLAFGVTTTLAEYRADRLGYNENGVHLPDISICNTNPFGSNANLVQHLPNLQEFYIKVLDVTSCENCSASEKDELQEFRNLFLNAWAYAAYIGPDDVKRIGHSLESMLVDCRLLLMEGRAIKQMPCFPDIKVLYRQDINFYNCYSLRLPTSSQTSNLYIGASLVLHLDNFFQDHLMFFDKTNIRNHMSGIELSLHIAGMPQFLDFDSVFLPPGLMSVIKVKQERRKRKQHPYGTCKNYMKSRYYDIGTYSMDYCYASCVQSHVSVNCGCMDISPYSHVNTSFINYTKCFDLDHDRKHMQQTWKCVFHQRHAAMRPCTLHCTLPCKDLTYQTQVSTVHKTMPITTNWPVLTRGQLQWPVTRSLQGLPSSQSLQMQCLSDCITLKFDGTPQTIEIPARFQFSLTQIEILQVVTKCLFISLSWIHSVCSCMPYQWHELRKLDMKYTLRAKSAKTK